MKSFHCLVALSIVTVHVRAETVKLTPRTFTIPKMDEPKRVAASPLLQRPIHMCFDDQHALCVTDSSGDTRKALLEAVSGLVVKETVDKVFLAPAEGNLESVPFREIEQTRYTHVSLVPKGLDELLNPEKIADVVAYLKSSKPTDGSVERQQNER